MHNYLEFLSVPRSVAQFTYWQLPFLRHLLNEELGKVKITHLIITYKEACRCSVHCYDWGGPAVSYK